ncbi:type II secretion system protein, partial [Streptococcus pneumoniae]|uniref:type II secretion system protein n=1 Tax=Streptococcus pneumoniae TaxID=1313 RepID=UPI000ADCEE68
MSKLTKTNKGFTIIEVMIVLAIAGLILLIVFLAVPALQRNSRNTQRKQDSAAALAAINEYANNNNGTLPSTDDQLNDAIANARGNIYDFTDDANAVLQATDLTGPGNEDSGIFFHPRSQCAAIPTTRDTAVAIVTGGAT